MAKNQTNEVNEIKTNKVKEMMKDGKYQYPIDMKNIFSLMMQFLRITVKMNLEHWLINLMF